MTDKCKFSFRTKIEKAYIEKTDGSMHVVAVASDSLPDYENDRMSEECIDGFVRQCKSGVDIIDNHNTTFAFGTTVDAWKEDGPENSVRLVIDILLKKDYPQSADLFQEISTGTPKKQLSIGGWIDPDAGISYEVKNGERITVINGIILDHIATTRHRQACNDRTGFVGAAIKALANSNAISIKKYRNMITNVVKEKGGKIVTGITSDGGVDSHFHEFAMYINPDGELEFGETGNSIWGEIVHTHNIAEVYKTEDSLDHSHILMVGLLELSRDNKIVFKVMPEEVAELASNKELYQKWFDDVYESIQTGELTKNVNCLYLSEISKKVEGLKIEDVFKIAFDHNSVAKFIKDIKSGFYMQFGGVTKNEIDCNKLKGLLTKYNVRAYEYGIYLKSIITGEDFVGIRMSELQKIKTDAEQTALDIKRDIERSIAKEEECPEFDITNDIVKNIQKSLVENFDYEKSIIIEGTEIELPIPDCKTEDIVKRIFSLSNKIGKSAELIDPGYNADKTEIERGHFHKYIIKEGDGFAFKSIGHSHEIKNGYIVTQESHVHKLGENVMTRKAVPFVSVEKTSVDTDIDTSILTQDAFALYDDEAKKGYFLHHNEAGVVLRGLITSYAEILRVKSSENDLTEEEIEEAEKHLNQHLAEFDIESPSELKDRDDLSDVSFSMFFEKQGVDMSWFDEVIKSETEDSDDDSDDDSSGEDENADDNDSSDDNSDDDDSSSDDDSEGEVGKSIFAKLAEKEISGDGKKEKNADPEEEDICDLLGLRAALDHCITLATGTKHTPELLLSLNKISEYVSKNDIFNIESIVSEKVKTAIGSFVPEIVKCLKDIASDVGKSKKDSEKIGNALKSLNSRVESIEGYSGSSRQVNTTDVDKSTDKVDDVKDGEEFSGIFSQFKK